MLMLPFLIQLIFEYVKNILLNEKGNNMIHCFENKGDRGVTCSTLVKAYNACFQKRLFIAFAILYLVDIWKAHN